MICCTEYYDFGCFSNCSPVELPAPAEVLADGDYVIQYKINNSNALHIVTVATGVTGQPVIIPFNVTSGLVTFTVTFADGSVLRAGPDDVECLKLKITPTFIEETFVLGD